MPKRLNTVTVVGSVLNPVTIPYDPKYSVSKYIEFAGGYKDYADPDKSYVLLPNGMSVHQKEAYYFLILITIFILDQPLLFQEKQDHFLV